MATSTDTIKNGWHTQPITDALGIRIAGIDLAQDRSLETRRSLADLLYRHHVIVISGQLLTTAQYLEFGQWWGQPIKFLREDQRVEGHPDVIIVSNSPTLFKEGERDYAVHWHSDSTYEEQPASITMLYCVESPDEGGETLFANTQAAFAALPESRKAALRGLMVTHRAGAGQRDEEFGERPHSKKAFSADAQTRIKTFVHPLVMDHPVNRQPVLFGVAGTATGVEGMEKAPALDLIRGVKRHVLQNAFRMSYRAVVGDILIWDNFSVIHTATAIDYSEAEGERRLLHRISVKGFPG